MLVPVAVFEAVVRRSRKFGAAWKKVEASCVVVLTFNRERKGRRCGHTSYIL